MTGRASTRIIAFVLLVVARAFCQRHAAQSSLPDAPPAHNVDRVQIFRTFLDTVRPSAATSDANPDFGLKYDPLHLQTDPDRTAATDLTAWNPSVLKPGPAFHGSTSNSLVGRATDAASSIVLTRDEDGTRKLNTQYLLRLLTATTAHVADRRYGRRTVGQPLSDFGSTLGNDAGMNVLHEFQPGLLQLVKTHEPKFVSRIQERVHRK